MLKWSLVGEGGVACIVFLGRWEEMVYISYKDIWRNLTFEEMVYISYKDIWRKSDIWGNGNLKCFAFTVWQLSQTLLYIYASYNRHSIYIHTQKQPVGREWERDVKRDVNRSVCVDNSCAGLSLSLSLSIYIYIYIYIYACQWIYCQMLGWLALR